MVSLCWRESLIDTGNLQLLVLPIPSSRFFVIFNYLDHCRLFQMTALKISSHWLPQDRDVRTHKNQHLKGLLRFNQMCFLFKEVAACLWLEVEHTCTCSRAYVPQIKTEEQIKVFKTNTVMVVLPHTPSLLRAADRLMCMYICVWRTTTLFTRMSVIIARIIRLFIEIVLLLPALFWSRCTMCSVGRIE